jgi:hypothetical protein
MQMMTTFHSLIIGEPQATLGTSLELILNRTQNLEIQYKARKRKQKDQNQEELKANKIRQLMGY